MIATGVETRRVGRPSDYLGNSAKSIHTDADQVRESFKAAQNKARYRSAKFDLTRHAGALLYKPELSKADQHRTCWCHRGFVSSAERATVRKSADGAARLQGVTTCGAVWTCPVCAIKVANKRRDELSAAMVKQIGQGGRVYLVTLTFPHESDLPLAESLAKLDKARQRFKNSRIYKGLFNVRDSTIGARGAVTSLEVTYGHAHGWHPHAHMLLFVRDAFVERDGGFRDEGWQYIDDRLQQLNMAWANALMRAGLCTASKVHQVLAVGLDVRGGQDAADYVTKWGREEQWGMTSELTLSHAKTGEGRDGGAKPFELLAMSAEGEGWAADRFIEYAEAFAGKRMLTWSPGLRKSFGLEDECSDEEEAAADDAKPEDVTIGHIDGVALSMLAARCALGRFLEYCALYAHDQSDIDEWIEDLKTRGRRAQGTISSPNEFRGRKYYDAERESNAN